MNYLVFPQWLKPEIIPGLPFRWYSLGYVIAFYIAYVLYCKQIKERSFPAPNQDDVLSMFIISGISLVAGARIFHCLVYESTHYYWTHPWMIFWPLSNGRWTGLAGMSYHGGVIGGIIGFTIFSIVKRYDVREIADMFGASIPLGYTFGRLGNFANGELWGRVTASRIGMIFPNAPRFPASIDWVRQAAGQAGIEITQSNAVINLPRYPTQLIEALFEGVVLWIIIWSVRNHKPFKGFLAGLYVGGYGVIRFFIEYFREPDANLGYRIQFGQKVALNDIAHLHPLTSFSTGQILCFGMVLLAALWLIIMARIPNNRPIQFYPKEAEIIEQNAVERKRKGSNNRHLREKIKRK
jgi:phosphatidylglycerol:prolipoprotein diacylglycerol transferase